MGKIYFYELLFVGVVLLGVFGYSLSHNHKRTNLFDDACYTCGGISHSDYTIGDNSLSPDSYEYHIVECDNGLQIRIFYNIGVINKWGKTCFLEKTLINCEDQRNKDHTISFPEIDYPNNCSESSTSDECYVGGYLEWKN